jgi:hypothetical protein
METKADEQGNGEKGAERQRAITVEMIVKEYEM